MEFRIWGTAHSAQSDTLIPDRHNSSLQPPQLDTTHPRLALHISLPPQSYRNLTMVQVHGAIKYHLGELSRVAADKAALAQSSRSAAATEANHSISVTSDKRQWRAMIGIAFAQQQHDLACEQTLYRSQAKRLLYARSNLQAMQHIEPREGNEDRHSLYVRDFTRLVTEYEQDLRSCSYNLNAAMKRIENGMKTIVDARERLASPPPAAKRRKIQHCDDDYCLCRDQGSQSESDDDSVVMIDRSKFDAAAKKITQVVTNAAMKLFEKHTATAASELAASEPAASECAVSEPVALEMEAAEPPALEPRALELAALQPATSEPAATEPAADEPTAAAAAVEVTTA